MLMNYWWKSLLIIYITVQSSIDCELQTKVSRGVYHLDVQNLVQIANPNSQNIMKWVVNDRKVKTDRFTLNMERTQIEFKTKGSVKVELTMTVAILKHPQNVLLCLNLATDSLESTEQECQQFKFVESQNGVVTTVGINWIFDVNSGDKLEVAVVGTEMIKKVSQFNRLLMYYI